MCKMANLRSCHNYRPTYWLMSVYRKKAVDSGKCVLYCITTRSGVQLSASVTKCMKILVILHSFNTKYADYGGKNTFIVFLPSNNPILK